MALPLHLIVAAGCLFLLVLGELLTFQALIAFFFGILLTIAGLLAGIIVLLNIGEQKAKEAKDLELKAKVCFTPPTVEETTDAGSQYNQYVTILTKYFTKHNDKWMWGTIRGNMLLWREVQDPTKGRNVLRLDGCSIAIVKTKEGALWKNRNFIKIAHPTRELYAGQKECHLFSRNAKEMEEWYHVLVKGCKITSREHIDAEVKSKGLFRDLLRKLGGVNEPTSPADVTFLNALAHRIFYNVHQDPGFSYKITSKIQKQLDKIKKPSILKSLKVTKMDFGPKLPIFSNVVLLSLSPEGEIKLEADADYMGNFQMSIYIHIDIEVLGKHFEVPVSVNITVKRLIGKVQIHMAPPPADRIWLGFYHEPEVEVDIAPNIYGADFKFASIPKLANIVVHKLKQEIVEMMVLPEMNDIPLPLLKPPPGEKKGKLEIPWEYAAGVVVTEPKAAPAPVTPATAPASAANAQPPALPTKPTPPSTKPVAIASAPATPVVGHFNPTLPASTPSSPIRQSPAPQLPVRPQPQRSSLHAGMAPGVTAPPLPRRPASPGGNELKEMQPIVFKPRNELEEQGIIGDLDDTDWLQLSTEFPQDSPSTSSTPSPTTTAGPSPKVPASEPVRRPSRGPFDVPAAQPVIVDGPNPLADIPNPLTETNPLVEVHSSSPTVEAPALPPRSVGSKGPFDASGQPLQKTSSKELATHSSGSGSSTPSTSPPSKELLDTSPLDDQFFPDGDNTHVDSIFGAAHRDPPSSSRDRFSASNPFAVPTGSAKPAQDPAGVSPRQASSSAVATSTNNPFKSTKPEASYSASSILADPLASAPKKPAPAPAPANSFMASPISVVASNPTPTPQPPTKESSSLRNFRPGGLRDKLTKKFDSFFGSDLNHTLQTPSPSTSPPNNELKPVKRNSQEGDGIF